ncbi:PHP domain-containing protein [Staphylococcus aureus]
MHTTYSDGAFSIRDMVEANIAKGYKLMVITDHSQSLRVANGLQVERLLRQNEEIKKCFIKNIVKLIFIQVQKWNQPYGSLIMMMKF